MRSPLLRNNEQAEEVVGGDVTGRTTDPEGGGGEMAGGAGRAGGTGEGVGDEAASSRLGR